MNCKTGACPNPAFQPGGPDYGCLSWRKSFKETIAIGDAFVEWTYEAKRTTLVKGVLVTQPTLTAPNFATLTIKNQRGDVIVDGADMNAFAGLANARPAGVALKAPLVMTRIDEGQKITLRVTMNAAEAAAQTFRVILFGHADKGCGADAACLQEPECQTYVTSKAFPSLAATLPDPDSIEPTTPMTVEDVFVSAAVDLDGGGASTEIAFAQVNVPLAESADVLAYSQDVVQMRPFRVQRVNTKRSLDVEWSGDAQTAANVFLVTLSGYRDDPEG